MSKTNCINCGAAKDTSELKCPFCGTTYLDFTAIDFTSHEPVVCEFVLPGLDKRIVMSMLAIPDLCEIKQERSDITVLGGFNNSPIAYLTDNYTVNVGINFKPVIKPGSNQLMSLHIEEE